MTSKAEKRLERKLTKENLWMYIIAVLRDEPSHAYGVRIRLRERFGLNIPTVTVYTVLYRMVSEGLLRVRKIGETKIYEPTEEGLEALSRAMKMLRMVADELERREGEDASTGGPAGI